MKEELENDFEENLARNLVDVVEKRNQFKMVIKSATSIDYDEIFLPGE